MDPSPQTATMRFFIGAAIASIAAIMFSSKAIFIKLGYAYPVGPVTLLALRMSFSIPFFLILAYTKRPPKKEHRLSLQELLVILLLGLAGFYLASLFDFIGLTYITASLERLLLFVYPTLVVIFDALYNRKPIQRNHIYALLLTYLGLVFAFWDKLEVSGGNEILIGAVWVFGAALSYAIYMVGSGQLIPKVGAMRYTAHAMMAAFLGIATHYLFFGKGDILQMDPEVYRIAFYIAIIATVIPMLLFSEAIGRIGASHVAIIGSIGPIATLIMAWYFLDETISIYQLWGTVFVLSGVVYISLSRKRN